MRRIVGSMSTASATPPAYAENVPLAATTMAKAKTPQMIEGIPVRSLATIRTACARRPEGAYSLM